MARIVRIHETGGPEVLKLEEVENDPPGSGEVAIQVKALGLNRAEAMFRSGRYLEEARFPARLGYEAAGVVTAIGEGVTTFGAGDAVSVIPPSSISRWGTYGETATIPAEFVVKHPASLSWTDAAAIWMQYLTAYGGLIDIAKISRGDYVVITAASSSVGLAAIQIAKMVGATPVAVTRTGTKKAALLDAGAADVIASEEEDVVNRLRDVTKAVGARVVFDPVGGPAFEALTTAMAPGGILLLYGALSSQPTPFPLMAVLSKSLTLRGYRYKEILLEPERLAAAKRFILDGLTTGALKPIIAKTFRLDEIVDAHRYLESNRQFGKIVVTV
jgi:NADPH:quinone reductase-like Zn-dependent oxidoreductase